jgi:hypothetical protein
MRKALNIAAGIGGGTLVAIGVFFALDLLFKAAIPECAPNQIDGQCGLGTFLQLLYSAAGALVAWPIAASLLSWYLLRRQARNTTKAD